MRLIGEVSNNEDGILLGAYLLQNGIEAKIESERSGVFSVWIMDEDKIVLATELLTKFKTQSDKGVYREAVFQAKLLEEAKNVELDRYEKNQRNPRQNWNYSGYPPVITSTLIGICVAIWVFEALSPGMLSYVQGFLMISNPYQPGVTLTDELLKGQVWRLFTPSILHFPLFEGGKFQIMGVLHILFNMLWLRQLGGIVERKHGSRYILILFLIFAALPNLLQYSVTGPMFLGMSGVNYALLCFLWIRGRFDSGYGLRLDPGIIMFMLVWFVFGFFGSGTANLVHLGGVICGCGWGYLSSRHWQRS